MQWRGAMQAEIRRFFVVFSNFAKKILPIGKDKYFQVLERFKAQQVPRLPAAIAQSACRPIR